MQRVLVAADANGIGRAVAQSFAAAGAPVHVADLDDDAVAAMVGSDGVTETIADVSARADADRLFDGLRRGLGGLDVLVNNAGIAGPTALIEGLDDAAWSKVVDINLTGTFLVTKRAIPLLKESPAASIITISSLAGLHSYPNRVAYLRHGKLVETGPVDQLFDAPAEPYTCELLEAISRLETAVDGG